MNKDNIQEPEEKDQQEPKGNFASFSPFTEQAVKEKSYAGSAPPPGANLNNPAPEPSYTPPPPPPPPGASSSGPANSKSAPPPPPPVNPAMNDLPPKEKQAASEAAADAVLSGYKILNQLAGKLVQFNMTKLEEEHARGDIDLEMPLNIQGQTVTAREYMLAYNAEQNTVFEVTEEFIEEVRPVLIRVLKKRGVGMTDEQLLIYYFGKDVVIKIFMMFSMIRSNNMVENSLRDATKAFRTGVVTPPPPPTPPPAADVQPETVIDADPPPPPATSAAAMVDEMINPEKIQPNQTPTGRASRRLSQIGPKKNNGEKGPGRRTGSSKQR